MAIAISTGACLYYSTGIPTTKDDNSSTGYPSLTWVEIGNVEMIGDIGDTNEEVTVITLKDGRSRILFVGLNGGKTSITLNADRADTAQNALRMRARGVGQSDISFQIKDPATTAGGTGKVIYFEGQIGNWRDGERSRSTNLKTTAEMSVNTALAEFDGTYS